MYKYHWYVSDLKTSKLPSITIYIPATSIEEANEKLKKQLEKNQPGLPDWHYERNKLMYLWNLKISQEGADWLYIHMNEKPIDYIYKQLIYKPPEVTSMENTL